MSTNSYFDGMIEDQVEQFNEHVEASANFHRHMLETLCAERMRRDCEVTYGPSPPTFLPISPPRPIRSRVFDNRSGSTGP